MREAAGKVRRWWGTKAAPSASVPYEILCSCGHLLRGSRAEKFQVVNCPECNRRQFVLPSSRLPLPQGEAPVGSRSQPLPTTWAKWRLPVLASSATLILVVLAIGVVVRLGKPTPQAASKGEGPEEINKYLSVGKEALSQGNFRLAVEKLDAAETLHSKYPNRLSVAERRELKQLQRQAALLTDLLSESPDVVLEQAANTSERSAKEWQEEFNKRFKGKAIIFDDEVRNEGAGIFGFTTLTFSVRQRPARVALKDLQLMGQLRGNLDTPKRLIFGARLASVRLEEGGVWHIHLEPESGVLLTDLGAVRACCPIPPEELRPILDRQSAWTADMP